MVRLCLGAERHGVGHARLEVYGGEEVMEGEVAALGYGGANTGMALGGALQRCGPVLGLIRASGSRPLHISSDRQISTRPALMHREVETWAWFGPDLGST